MNKYEQIDIDFNFAIRPPARTFADTMRLFYGWRKPLKVTPYVANIDGVDEHIEGMQLFAASVYDDFGGGDGKFRFDVYPEIIMEYVESQSGRYMTHTFLDEVASLALRYLDGEGDNYERFHRIQKMI